MGLLGQVGLGPWPCLRRRLQPQDPGVKGNKVTPSNNTFDAVAKVNHNNEVGSLVKADLHFCLENFQEAIARAMKDAMSIQLQDWLGAGKKKESATSMQEERQGNVEAHTLNSSQPVGNVALNGSGSQGSHAPSTVPETPMEKNKGEQDMEVGSSTRELLFQAGEQVSRELKQKALEEKEQEKEVVSPDTRKRRNTPTEKDATRTSIRQYQKRGGKACTRGETVARAELRKQTHMSPGTSTGLSPTPGTVERVHAEPLPSTSEETG